MDKIKVFVENVFYGLPKTRDLMVMKEEILNNMEEHYADLLAQGKDEATAFGMVVADFGSVEDLRHELQLDEQLYDEGVYVDDEQCRSEFDRKFRNGIIAGIVCAILAVFGLAWLEEVTYEEIAFLWFLVFGTFATVLFVYWGMERSRIEKDAEALMKYNVERTREYPQKKKRNQASTLLWEGTVLIYLILGFVFGLWHPGWLLFLVAAFLEGAMEFFYK